MARRGERIKAFLLALAWLCGLVAVGVWLGWRLYHSAQDDALQAVADGRTVIVALPEITPTGVPSKSAQALTADVPEAAMFPPRPPAAAAPAPLTPKPGESLAAAPDPALTEQLPMGPLPKIGGDGTKPWLAYAHMFSRSGSSPIIAILVTGVGMSKETSDAALALPSAITLGLSPYAPQVKLWGDAARALGHETLMDLPMQGADFPADDPGPQGLLVMNAQEGNLQHLRWILTRAPGAIGVDIGASERFSMNNQAALPVYRFLSAHGLMAAFAPGGPTEAQEQLRTDAAVPFARADLALDDVPDTDSIDHQLATLENIAVRHGYAFGVGRAYPVTLKTLQVWAQALGKKGIILAPVSALARMKFS